MTDAERNRFDAIVERVIASLPARVAAWLERVPVIVLDRPTPDILADLGMDDSEADTLCGLHTGVSNTEAGVTDDPTTPPQIHLFRAGIIEAAGGWGASRGEAGVESEVRITLLHELGHQMGLDEEDLDELGYA